MLHELTGRGLPRPVPYAVGLAVAALMEFVLAPRTGKPPAFHVEEVRTAGLSRLADSTKAIGELGLPQRPLRETLARTIEWIERSGIGGTDDRR